jgi:hypothetical protein
MKLRKCPCAYDMKGAEAIRFAKRAWVYAHASSIGCKERNNQSRWDFLPSAGVLKGRNTTIRGVIVETCLPVKEFAEFAEMLGIDSGHLRARIKRRVVRLAPGHSPIWCFVFPGMSGVQDENN